MGSFPEYTVLQNRGTDEKYYLDDEGAVLTEKMAKELDVEPGDTITVRDEDKGDVTVKISAVCENYMGHYLFMTPALYEAAYGEAPEYNSDHRAQAGAGDIEGAGLLQQ